MEYEDLDAIFNNPDHTKIILGGDLNSKHTSWNCRRSNTRGNKLKNHSERYNYSVRSPDLPTHFSNNTADILDIFLNKNINLNMNIYTKNQLSSDHKPTIFETENWTSTQSTSSLRKYTGISSIKK